MVKSDSTKSHPLRFRHPNYFPPSLKSSYDNFSTSFEEDEVDVEVPIVFVPPEDHPETLNHRYPSVSAFGVVWSSSTSTDRRQRSTLLESLQVPPSPGYFEGELMRSRTTTFPTPLRRRPNISLKPLSIPHCSLPPVPPTQHSHPAPKITLAPMQTRPRRDGVPQTPSSLAPARMTGLLTDLLSIMNTIMDRKQSIQEEDTMLLHLTELVAIMQEEAEALLDLADLVEEFVEQVEITSDVADVEGWVEISGLDQAATKVGTTVDKVEGIMASMPGKNAFTGNHGYRVNHEREKSFDSALGMIDESELDGISRELRESTHQDFALQVAQMGRRGRARGNLIEIGKRRVRLSERKTLNTQFIPHHQKAPLGSTGLDKGTPHRDTVPFRDFASSPSPSRTLKQNFLENSWKQRPPRWI
ncbi:hypothetical protein QTJ16_006662 [Diplocarpon rosae]|uniref:Uncharacterized protein n=1 Tax=Diplocarpon rosae TaxID=946125 RepID=A0AAD9SVQ7_9HELO|nr:hypothetical protein QTJ16_006662 [Diplocarpon rosae]